MIKDIKCALISSIFASSIGCIIIVFMMLTASLEYGYQSIKDMLGLAGVLYLSAFVACCLICIFIASPIYLILKRFDLENYCTSFGFGVIVITVWFGVPELSMSMGWHLTGGIIGLLFHNQFKNSKF